MACARNKKGKQIKLGEGEANKKSTEKGATNESIIRSDVKGGVLGLYKGSIFYERVYCEDTESLS